jgi:hypothetical protein
MTLFDDLVERFCEPTKVEPWGMCLTIQSPEFDMAWVKPLVDLGYSIFIATLDEYPVIFIPCKTSGLPMSPTGAESVINEVCTLQKNDKKEKTESYEPTTIDQSNLLLDLVQKYQGISEGYQSLSKAYTELKNNFNGFVEEVEGDFEETLHNIEAGAQENAKTNAQLLALKMDVTRHKHADSGEAMLPMETKQT